MKLLVTGVNGFIGQGLVKRLTDAGKYEVTGIVRNKSASIHSNIETVTVSEITAATDWQVVLKNVDGIVHLAARAHVLNDSSADPLAEFRKVNVEGTLNLARQAARAGVKRFVFISSIGVNGNSNEQPFTEMDRPSPVEAYAVSKYEAECGLQAIASETGMEVVIIRPPLVYGPNAPGNFRRLMDFAAKSIPLPFGAVDNKRSLIALDNLVEFIVICIDHPNAANEIFLIADGEDVSTIDLLKMTARAFGRKLLLIPVPVSWLYFAAKLIGEPGVAKSLLGSLRVDSTKAKRLLGWSPVITMEAQLQKAAEAYFK
ncbi:UDP-glucose 4-epimerase family protein [Methylotuvimicrobium buryatense]|uniref:SDR family oxidoreductase n=1 Tax=Methylotuvimicrobium buryatense TaxID=95641 RepID=A0A4P9UIC3_METBY|nr:SDR family oxidoreductase [Methylotuvimicrobium buryatense]QCW80882.1 SDR family oxidoreductase [Methylotuvimicrobium buryatense]